MEEVAAGPASQLRRGHGAQVGGGSGRLRSRCRGLCRHMLRRRGSGLGVGQTTRGGPSGRVGAAKAPARAAPSPASSRLLSAGGGGGSAGAGV